MSDGGHGKKCAACKTVIAAQTLYELRRKLDSHVCRPGAQQ